MHPDLERGGGHKFMSYFFAKICVMTQHPELQVWKKQGIEYALESVAKEQKNNVNSLEDTTDDDDFFGLNQFESIKQKEGEYDLSQIREFLETLSVNVVFDCSFIKCEEAPAYPAYCPCHQVYKVWNRLTGMDKIIDPSDVCVPTKGKPMYSRGGMGLKSHITKKKTIAYEASRRLLY